MKRQLLRILFLMLSAVPCRAQTPSALTELGAQAGEPVEAIQKGLDEVKVSAETRELFAIKEIRGKRLLEIRREQFGPLFLFAATIDKGTGERRMFGATMADTFVWHFRRVEGGKVQMLIKQTQHRAGEDAPRARAIAESYPDGLVATLPVLSSGTAPGSVVVDAAAFFLQDLLRVDRRLRAAYKRPMRYMEKDSYVEKLASFPINLEVRVVLNYMPADGDGAPPPGLSPNGMLPVTMHYSLTKLPSSEGFQPRAADPRVGYFQTDFQDHGDAALRERLRPGVHLINRWHLEKADPSAEVSDVKKPIVYWLDRTIPHEYRDYVRAGILAWNAAFEAAGLRNAIVVKDVETDMPADERARFDPANAAYNVVRWFMGDMTTLAVAPSRANPLTGEIFNTSIRIGDQITRITDRLTRIAVPSAGGFHEHDALCSHWAPLQQAADALRLAQAQGPLDESERRVFLGQLLTQLIAHETGHTLGLRHNFAGGELHELPAAGSDGLVSSSFMHYVTPNIGPDGRPRGVYYQSQVGPYDRWAVTYGYKPLDGDAPAVKDALEAIASRTHSDPRLKYCTDEDAVNTGGMDPRCQRFTLGRDVVAFARERVALAEKALERLRQSAPATAADVVQRRGTLETILGVYRGSAASVLPAIGGVRVDRAAPGNGGKPIEAVPAAEQRSALKYLDEKVFNAAAYRFPPELLQTAGLDRLSNVYQPSQPLPLAEIVLTSQKEALDHIYHPQTLRRLADPSLAGRQAIVAGEVMITVRRSIWKEIEGGRAGAIELTRRNLQRVHLERLVALRAAAGMPGDALAQARRDLEEIAGNARRARSAPGLDEASRAHLEDMARTAEDALAPRDATRR